MLNNTVEGKVIASKSGQVLISFNGNRSATVATNGRTYIAGMTYKFEVRNFISTAASVFGRK